MENNIKLENIVNKFKELYEKTKDYNNYEIATDVFDNFMSRLSLREKVELRKELGLGTIERIANRRRLDGIDKEYSDSILKAIKWDDLQLNSNLDGIKTDYSDWKEEVMSGKEKVTEMVPVTQLDGKVIVEERERYPYGVEEEVLNNTDEIDKDILMDIVLFHIQDNMSNIERNYIEGNLTRFNIMDIAASYNENENDSIYKMDELETIKDTRKLMDYFIENINNNKFDEVETVLNQIIENRNLDIALEYIKNGNNEIIKNGEDLDLSMEDSPFVMYDMEELENHVKK